MLVTAIIVAVAAVGLFSVQTATETALQMRDTSVMYDILNLMLTKS